MNVTVGQRAQRTIRLTSEHVKTFAALTGDYNPLHFDESFAASTKFGALVVQGGLTTGLLHALVATDLPGPGSVFLSQNWKFTAPVYIGDTITADAEVISVHPSKPVTQLHVRVTRQTGESVLDGEAWCYTLRPKSDEISASASDSSYVAATPKAPQRRGEQERDHRPASIEPL